MLALEHNQVLEWAKRLQHCICYKYVILLRIAKLLKSEETHSIKRGRSTEVLGSKKFDKYQMQWCVSWCYMCNNVGRGHITTEQTSKKTRSEEDFRRCQSILIHLPIWWLIIYSIMCKSSSFILYTKLRNNLRISGLHLSFSTSRMCSGASTRSSSWTQNTCYS